MLIIGTNSDEGVMFARPVEPDDYKKGIGTTLWRFSGKILEAFPGETKEQAQTSTADISHNSICMANLGLGRLQSRTGKSKDSCIIISQPQPEMPFLPIKPRGAQHAAEIKYVLKKLRYWQRSPMRMQNYLKLWPLVGLIFARYGGSQMGENLPAWSEFSEETHPVMHLKYPPEQGRSPKSR